MFLMWSVQPLQNPVTWVCPRLILGCLDLCGDMNGHWEEELGIQSKNSQKGRRTCQVTGRQDLMQRHQGKHLVACSVRQRVCSVSGPRYLLMSLLPGKDMYKAYVYMEQGKYLA